MTDRELMQQALEALESGDWYIGQLEPFVYGPDDAGTHEERAKVQAAIAALRERLARCDDCGKPLGGDGHIHTCSPQRLAQPEFDDALQSAAPPQTAVKLAQPEQYQRPQMRRATREEKISRPGVYWVPVEQEPVKQEPLTEKRIEELYSFWVVDCQDIVGFARAIERHKAKPQMQPCAGRNCGSTDPNLHSAECFEDYEKATGMNQPEPKCAVIVEVFGKDWRLDYMALPVGKHKLYTQQYTYTAPSQRKPLPPQSPCEMTQAERKMFRLGWLECEAAHGIKEDA